MDAIKVRNQVGVSIGWHCAGKICLAVPAAVSASRDGVNGRKYLAGLKVNGGKAPYAWSLLSALHPTGLSFDAAKGMITGVSTAMGKFILTFPFSSSLSEEAQKTFTLGDCNEMASVIVDDVAL